MKLIYFKADIGNFGDDLNDWLWEKIFGDFKNYPDVDFVGIGSILDERLDNDRKKLIFGSGVRSFLYQVSDPSKYDIRFVRGPVSAKVLDEKFITDSAYALKLIDDSKDHQKKYDVSFIPYYRHYHFLNKKMISSIAGVNIINPLLPVEEVIKEVKASRKIIAAAMHGAILADIYRIPWRRCRIGRHGFENYLTSELKWEDWSKSLDIDDLKTLDIDVSLHNHPKIINTLKSIYIARAIKKAKNDYTLSDDEIFWKRINELKVEIEKLKNESLFTPSEI